MILLKKKVNKLRTRTILGDVDGDDNVDEEEEASVYEAFGRKLQHF